MTSADTDQATPAAIALATPCWWIDRGDCWEITHHATREDAEAGHADRVRSDEGWVLSVAGAFAIVPGVARQEPRRCYEVTCPECGAVGHHQTRFTACPAECGYDFVLKQIPQTDPDQIGLFDDLPTHDR
jgi:hypothetical protein